MVGYYTNGLAVLYLLVHSSLLLFGREHRLRRTRLLINALLILVFLFILYGLPANREGWVRAIRLWSPVVFFWWAYLWSKRTHFTVHPPGFSLDRRLIRLEDRWFGQPSLNWARVNSRWLTEVMNFFYGTYYFYTPLLGFFLYLSGRFREFEEMTFAVLFGYAFCYTCAAFFPVWGPRWAYQDYGFLYPWERRLPGYWITEATHRLMFGGIASKGGAMPSAHSSTAMVFLVWCWWLWGAAGGIPASVTVTGMWFGSVYGRYHYLVDLLAGALLGVASLAVAAWLF